MKSFREFQQLYEGSVKDVQQTIKYHIGPIFASGAAPVEQKHIKKAVDAVVKDHKMTPDAARKMVDSYCKTPTIPKAKGA
jgi:hypothetical protein